MLFVKCKVAYRGMGLDMKNRPTWSLKKVRLFTDSEVYRSSSQRLVTIIFNEDKKGLSRYITVLKDLIRQRKDVSFFVDLEVFVQVVEAREASSNT